MEKMANNFKINEIAKNYVSKKFPLASKKEKEKIIKDWERKIKVSRLVVDDFKQRIGNPRGMKILDDGCGNGGLAIAFSETMAEIFGVDVEKKLIDISQEHASNYKVSPQFVFYDGKKLPFEDNFFDAAISVSVLEHVSDPINYLREILRVLKPRGSLYLAFPNKLWPRATHTLLWFIHWLPYKIAASIVKYLKHCPYKDNNLHFYTYWNLKNILEKSGKWMIKEEEGRSKNIIKNSIKIFLDFFGLSYKYFLPHIQLILTKNGK